MTFTNHWVRNYGQVTITRIRNYELDFAIEELVKRGYELINRGGEEKDVKQFSHHEGLGSSKLIFSRSNVHRKYWAVLKKVDNTSEIPPSVTYTV